MNSIIRNSRYCVAIAALLLCAVAWTQGPPANYDESKVGVYTLPDPLVFNNGKPVASGTDWMKRRRREILELFEANVYGHNPPPPKSIRYEVFDVDQHALDGKAIRRQVTIYFSPRKDGPKEDVLIYIPVGARKPVPVMLSLNFFGNQAASNDPGIKLATVWNPRTHEKQQASEQSRGREKEGLERVLALGYGFATVCYQDIEPDFKGGYVHGIRPLFLKSGQSEPAPDDWGAIGAWSYGLGRAMDYLEKDKDVDSKRVAVMGHSRLGKTVLWAGAVDQRFAMVLSSCSGEGGASLARRNYGETIRNLVDRFPYWFCANFQKYADHVDQLPVDTHELIALIAPRPVYVTGAEEDRWADPKGEFLACVAAGPVYRLFGGSDLGTDRMPALNQPVMRTIAYHYRTGKHEVTAFDWEQFLVFADSWFKKHSDKWQVKSDKQNRDQRQVKSDKQERVLDSSLVTSHSSLPAPPPRIQTEIPSVYESLSEYFPVGAAIFQGNLIGPHSQLLKKHFNSIVAENDMKPGPLQPTEGTFNFTTADALVSFARANRMLVRGHTLVWHNQNPSWLFRDPSGNDLQPTPENKALLLKRLENHIRAVVSHYRDDVYAWDVVNEVIDPSQRDGFRRNEWFRITGTDYIERAFRVAHEVAPNAKLYINDFSTTNPAKRAFLLNLARDLRNRGVHIDGIGHQMHSNIDFPSTAAIIETINMFSEQGFDNQITELDMSVYNNSTQVYMTVPEEVLIRQGYRYRDFFQTFRQLKGKISSVTFWGLADDHTWLKTFPITRLDLPLLFDEQLQAKHAYWGIIDPSRLPGAAPPVP